MKKYAKLKLLMLIPILKLVVCVSIPNKILSTVKLFADDISIFSSVSDANISEDELNKDLQKTPEWFYGWKMSFNPDLRSDFLRKLNESNHPKIYFNSAPVFCANRKNI